MPPAIDHLNCVTFSFGANSPDRVPRRTNSTGAGAASAIAERVGPRPSRCHRSDRPSTSRPAPVGRGDDAVAPAGDDERLGGDAGRLLDEQPGVGEHAA